MKLKPTCRGAGGGVEAPCCVTDEWPNRAPSRAPTRKPSSSSPTAQGKLADWSAALADLAGVAADERVRAAIGDPNLAPAKVAGLFISVLAGRLSGDAREPRARARGERPPGGAARDPRAVRGAQERARRRGRRRGLHGVRDGRRPSSPTWSRRLERKTGRKVKPRVTVDPVADRRRADRDRRQGDRRLRARAARRARERR